MIRYKKFSDSVHFIEKTPLRNKHSSTITVHFTTGGAFYEPTAKNGITHLLEHCIASAIDDRSTNELEKYLDYKNIDRNASTGLSRLNLTISGHRDDNLEMWHIISKMAFDPYFRQDILEQEQKVVESEINRKYGNPQYIVSRAVRDAIYKEGSPSLHEGLGYSHIVNKLTLNDLKEHHAEIMANSQILITANNLHDRNVIKELETFASSLKQSENVRSLVPGFTDTFKDGVYFPVVHEKAHEAASMTLFIPAEIKLENFHQRNFFNTILFNGIASVLFDHLRHNMGIIYSLHSSYSLLSETLEISTEVKIKDMAKVIEAFDIVINDSEKHIRERFHDVKKMIEKREQMIADNKVKHLDFLVGNFLAYGTEYHYHDYFERVHKLTVNEILVEAEKLKTNVKKMKILTVSCNPEIKGKF
jgi:predicted Zn-dependent peptidase